MSSITEADDHNYYFKFRFALVYFKKKQNTSTKQKKSYRHSVGDEIAQIFL